jgi:hypothetical protein
MPASEGVDRNESGVWAHMLKYGLIYAVSTAVDFIQSAFG